MYLYIQLLRMIRGRVAFYASASLVSIPHILYWCCSVRVPRGSGSKAHLDLELSIRREMFLFSSNPEFL